MSVRPILLWPDPRLRTECAPVDAPDLALIEDLFDTMYDACGRGLAAPQIGVMSRAFVVDVPWKEGPSKPMAFFNPVVRQWGDELATAEEQCLSIPDLPMPVMRSSWLVLEWMNIEGETQSGSFAGNEARCILHELDHLNGVVILDHQTPDARAALEASYGH